MAMKSVSHGAIHRYQFATSLKPRLLYHGYYSRVLPDLLNVRTLCSCSSIRAVMLDLPFRPINWILAAQNKPAAD